MTNNLSVSLHVCDVISSCAQTLYALRVMRAHGMNDSALQAIYRSVVVAKLLYASSAWWGFTTPADRQRLEGFLRRSKRWGFCSQSLDSFEELCKAANKQLFHNILVNSCHLLNSLLPPHSAASQNYQLRRRAHDRQLPLHSGKLIDSNFIIRQLYTNIY
jgi:hypothetical protein